jgi:hypothetical protein
MAREKRQLWDLERMRRALDRKARVERARVQAEERSLIGAHRPPDDLSPRAKSTGHGKKTADKWNQ